MNWMAELAVDEHSATPLYRQLAAQLIEAIDSRRVRHGEALPSERRLASHCRISRITARRALDEVIELGLAERNRGAGTFVMPRVKTPLNRLTGFSQALEARGLVPRSRWLTRDIRVPDGDTLMRLGLHRQEPVAYLKRQRLADECIVAVEESWLPRTLLPRPEAVEQSLYRYLEAHGHCIERALQHVSAVNADAALAELAGVEEGRALLRITRLGYLDDERPAELTISWCRPDHYDVVVELQRSPRETT
ncbi:GntR family transcriptional regulator [Kushneria sinocarnis]|uniref:GntR family transcriptional regulator n=1 Tax=Kushneria sinocarnis TaxID=595502 RepID=A0A420WUD9_9GAMM|nr:GntR family transcriptional regulator [Kushneria sinocarnis]RKQ97069.1 GntR family transcriptional regulator [Kushneria sinocarnis]